MAAHDNRGRLAVTLDGNWRLYQQRIPTGSTALGTVTRGAGQTEALIVTGAGIYAGMSGNAIRALDQNKVAAAIAAARKWAASLPLTSCAPCAWCRPARTRKPKQHAKPAAACAPLRCACAQPGCPPSPLAGLQPARRHNTPIELSPNSGVQRWRTGSSVVIHAVHRAVVSSSWAR